MFTQLSFETFIGGKKVRKTNIAVLMSVLLVMISFISPSAAQHEDIDFASHAEYSVNVGPSNIVAADLNGDGHLDLACACNGDFMTTAQNVSVLINRGNGTFEPHREYPTDLGPLDIAVGDLNGDGDLDLVTANAVLLGDNTLSVLLNKGDGTFATHVEYESDTVPEAVALADIDNDGDNDIICANNMGFSLSVLLNNGDGTFAARIDYDNEYLSMDVAVSDFDKDGYPDVATINNNWVNGNYSLSVFLNYGNGTLAPYDYYPTGDSPNALAVGDFDENGFVDIAVSKTDDNSLDIFLNEGDGTFSERIPYVIGHDADGLFAGDVDGDSHIDLITIYLSGYTAQRVEIAFGWGNASFGDVKTYSTASGSSAVLAADLDKDNKKDIAIANGGDMFQAYSTVSVLIQKEIEETNGNGIPENGNGSGDEKGSFFEEPIMLGIIVIVVIAVILSSALLISKKKKKKEKVQAVTQVAVPVAPAQQVVPVAPAVTQAPAALPVTPATPLPPPPAQVEQTIRCPNCGTGFVVKITQKPQPVECPHCHTKGKIG